MVRVHRTCRGHQRQQLLRSDRHYAATKLHAGGRTGCPGSGDSVRTTQIKIPAGHRIQWRDDQGSSPKDCTGNTIHISVAYVPNSYLGPNGIGSKPWPSLGRGAILVGKTTVAQP
jgi:hypothetical protein